MSVDKAKIAEELSNYLVKNVLAAGIKLKSNEPFSAVEIDSVTVIELVMFIEEKFRIEIPADQLLPENMSSIDSLADCALANLKAVG